MRWIRRREGQDRTDRPVARARDWRSWDDVAEQYERVGTGLRFPAARDLLALAGAAEGTRVLDVGAGTGAAVAEAARIAGARGLAVGVDLSEGMLAVGHRARPGAMLALAEAIDLPFREATFDVAIANFVLPFFAKLDTALHDCKRVLRPGGRFGATWWAAGADEMQRAWRTFADEAVGKEILDGALRETRPGIGVVEDPLRLEGALRDAGFRPVRVERRRYRFEMARDEWLASEETGTIGRFVRGMLGERGWGSWRARVEAAFAERFPERLVDFREVLLVIGTKP